MEQQQCESGSGRWGLAAVVVAGLALLSTGCGRPVESGRAVRPEREAVEVTVGTADWRPMERTLTVLGTLRALDRATLSIKTSGRVREVGVDVGSVARAGDAVVRLEERDYELRVRQAAAQLSQSRARLGLPLAGDDDSVDPESIGVVREARVRFEEAASNLERVRRLETERISSTAELERATAEHDVQRQRYLDALQEVLERQAILGQRRVEYEMARQLLADTVLRAPFDGVVQERLTSPGEYVSVGNPVMTLVRTDPLRLQAEVPERLAHWVRTGLTVRMTLEGEAKRFATRIARVSPALDERTRMLRIEADLVNPGHLRPGQFARVEVVVEEAAPALTVPEDALEVFAGTEKVFVVVGGKVEERRVVVGRREGGWLEVLEGVEAGARVVRRPEGLESGVPVRIAGGDAAEAGREGVS
ncbi:MAG: efflux RND transporter periplasmic adaptor subunit [Verrucomicrobiae bacterium]|nr:efflux RND transporter periplasmic adaptor subunit [Verrucomicrobiae bacterium]